jgi:DMSO/TMAO reductase YedYZ molybdopterin-dependent catalytic subunit
VSVDGAVPRDREAPEPRLAPAPELQRQNRLWGPFRPQFWRSPLRGPWLTAFLGTLLFPLVLVIALTGLISHGSYQPQLDGNSPFGYSGDIIGPLLALPASSPSWLYAATQGIHVTVGLVAIPVLLAKLWSVLPRLFAWPPVRTPAAAVERASLLLLVGGAVFEFATGVLNIQVFYPWHFNFVRAHYYGAWVFLAAFVVHVLIKLPTIARAYRARGFLRPLRQDLLHTRPEPLDRNGLVAVSPARPTLSRRGLLALVGGASLTLFVVNVGETVGGPLRRLALLAPRGRVFGAGPNDFQVNKTAAASRVIAPASDPGWRLTIRGARTVELNRTQLMRVLPLRTCEITLGCVEGWSTTQRWTGVRLADLAALVHAPASVGVHVESLETQGPYRQVTLTPGQVRHPQALLAMCVNGVDLSLDHGYPARIIAPAIPGVHCVKWVSRLSFGAI